MNVQVTDRLNGAPSPVSRHGTSGAPDTTDTTELAMQNTILTPRFYTTDFDEMDAIDVTPVRADWDKLLDQMRSDPNKGHFKKTEDWDKIDWDGMEPELKKEFIEFLVSSCTAEF